MRKVKFIFFGYLAFVVLLIAGMAVAFNAAPPRDPHTIYATYAGALRTLDPAEVEKAHRLYDQHGLGARDDATAMRYLIPDWTFDPKRPALDR